MAGDAVTDDDDSGPADQRLREAGSRRRPLWRWLLVGLLLIFSLVITALYLTTLTADLLQHRWGEALDASRGAVPAAVGWAALLIIFFGRGFTPAERLLSADQPVMREKQTRASRDADSVRLAEQRVRDLTARLAALTTGAGDAAAGDAAEPRHLTAPLPSSRPQLGRQVAETVARLDQARQWLASAHAARAASQQDVAAGPGPAHAVSTRRRPVTRHGVVTHERPAHASGAADRSQRLG